MLKDYSDEQLKEELENRKRDNLPTPELHYEAVLEGSIQQFSEEFHAWFTEYVKDHHGPPVDAEIHIQEMLIEFLYKDAEEYWKWYNNIVR